MFIVILKLVVSLIVFYWLETSISFILDYKILTVLGPQTIIEMDPLFIFNSPARNCFLKSENSCLSSRHHYHFEVKAQTSK